VVRRGSPDGHGAVVMAHGEEQGVVVQLRERGGREMEREREKERERERDRERERKRKERKRRVSERVREKCMQQGRVVQLRRPCHASLLRQHHAMVARVLHSCAHQP
jgi:hypothetical protein